MRYRIDVVAGDRIGKEIGPAARRCIDARPTDELDPVDEHDWRSRYLSDGEIDRDQAEQRMEDLANEDGIFPAESESRGSRRHHAAGTSDPNLTGIHGFDVA